METETENILIICLFTVIIAVIASVSFYNFKDFNHVESMANKGFCKTKVIGGSAYVFQRCKVIK